MKKYVLNGYVFLFMAIFLLVCCGEKEDVPKHETLTPDSKGRIRISGAWALYPLMVRWGEEFNKQYPGIRMDISAGGAGKGIADTLGGLVDIGMVSKEISEEEIKQGAFFVPVAKDAVFSVVSSSNPVLEKIVSEKGIKKELFVKLWVKGKSLTWGEITGEESDAEVQVYTRSDSCGAAQTWAKFLGDFHQEDLKGIGVYGDPGLADAVRRDPFGIGYNNLNFAFDFSTGLPVKGIKIVPIDINNNGRIDTEEHIRTKEDAIKAVSSGVYPSPPARDLYLIARGSFRGLSKALVIWILTEGQEFVNEAGYIKVRDEQISDALGKMEGKSNE